MGDYLMAFDIPIGPALGGAPAPEAEDVTVEPPRGLDVVHR